MAREIEDAEFDAIVVGSGPGGATVARELARRGKKVLILEQGGNAFLKESFLGFAAVARSDRVRGDDLPTMKAVTTGGSTAIYFAVAEPPPLDSFLSLGIDLSAELAEARRELPLAPLPDKLIGEQALRLKESALKLGFRWDKKMMLIDQSRCETGYSYDAKWKARSYVQEALENGATLISRATVIRVLVDKNKAIGVEYRLRRGAFRSEIRHAYAAKTVLAAGAPVSPVILRNSGIKDAGSRGFYCDPNFVLIGTAPGMKSSDNFVGCMGTEVDGDIALGDANLTRNFYRMWMLGTLNLSRLFSFSRSIGVGIKIKDGLGGELRKDGRYHKQLTREESAKLKKGEALAVRILQNAGAEHFLHGGVTALVGGVVRIKEHLDERLQTEYANLHVCDGSILPENIRVSPALTIICLGKYLAKRLFPC